MAYRRRLENGDVASRLSEEECSTLRWLIEMARIGIAHAPSIAPLVNVDRDVIERYSLFFLPEAAQGNYVLNAARQESEEV
jgi:hypothetical protein